MTPEKSLLRGPDGQPLLPSATMRADGKPRFVLPILPQLVATDGGISYLVERELHHGGFERTTRDVLDAHLKDGDLFLDIGAHWGTMSLSAITGPAKNVRAIAVEPAPLNITMLLRAIAINQAADAMVVVAAAAGRELSIVQFNLLESTMSNALDTSAARARRGLQVPVISVDHLMGAGGEDPARRVVMKIDVEGAEPDVLLGATQTIESGRVALIIWERGNEYRENESVRAKTKQATDWLSGLGFRHYTLPYHEWGGPLIPATDDWFFSNIFSFAPTVQKRDVYPDRFGTRVPFEAQFRMQRMPERIAEVARMCIEARTSDGIRWADPAELAIGAGERAAAAARLIAPNSLVLDLGAGSMALGRHLPPGCIYRPADLLARRDDCIVVDLNQGQFPDGTFPVIALLEVLEYVHDIEGLLMKCRRAAPRLVVSYRVQPSDQAARRRKGLLNDLSSEDLARALDNAGYAIAAKGACGEAVLWACVRLPEPESPGNLGFP